MRFHLIYDSENGSETHRTLIPQLFKEACDNSHVEYVPLDIQHVELSRLEPLGVDDLLYRSAISQRAVYAQRLLLSDRSTHFFNTWTNGCNVRGASFFTHEHFDIPTIPSVPGIPRDQGECEYIVEKLGGLPIIVKVLGGTMGVGVMRIDSFKSLNSVLDYVSSINEDILIRAYIPHEYYVRAVVVGDRVVAAHKAYALDGEFRTNAGDDTHQKREHYTLSPKAEKTVVSAVHVLGIQTAGVDLLFDEQSDKMYIAEVNFPNNFTVTQKITGVNIAEHMLHFLLAKQKSSRSSDE